MKRSIFFLFYLLIVSVFSGYAQLQPDSRPPGADSTWMQMQFLLQESEQLRIRDSIRAQVLQDELSGLKNNRGAQHRELEAELQRLRNEDSLRVYQQKMAIETLRSRTKGVPVTLFYDTLFVIYAPLGSFNASQRAFSAVERIRGLYNNTYFNSDSLLVTTQYGLINIAYGAETITSISNIDGIWANTSPDSLANSYARIIAERVSHFQQAYSARNIMLRIVYAVVAIAILVSVLLCIRYIFRKLKSKIASSKFMENKGIRFKNYQLLSPQYILTIILQILNILRIVCMLLAVYFTLTYIFSIFPSTHTWTKTLLGWLWQPVRRIGLAFFHYLPDLFTIVVIVVAVRFIARIFRFFSLEVERGILNIKGFHKEWAKPTYNIVRFFIYAFGFVVIFPYLPGSGSEAFKGVSVFLGILFSIGSSSAISNTIAGLVITYMRPFQVGDWIMVNDVTGYVVEKTVLVTRIRTIHNEDITVPNSTILSNHTLNYSSSGKNLGLLINARVTIGYDIPWTTVHALLIKAALRTEDIDTEQKPFVLQKALDDFNVVYEINVYTRQPQKMYFINSALLQNIQDDFREAGIEIMSPQQVNLRNYGHR